MKKFIPKSWDYLYDIIFINGYDTDGQKITLYYDDTKTEVLPYSRETEKEIVTKMKKQVLTAQRVSSTLNKDLHQTRLLFGMDTAVSLMNLGLAPHMEYPEVHYAIAGISALMAIFFGCAAFKNKEKMDELKKYSYFLEHERLINDDIIDHFMQEEDIEGYEPNTLSLNDIESYSLQELKDMVENITEQNKQRKLSLQ